MTREENERPARENVGGGASDSQLFMHLLHVRGAPFYVRRPPTADGRLAFIRTDNDRRIRILSLRRESLSLVLEGYVTESGGVTGGEVTP